MHVIRGGQTDRQTDGVRSYMSKNEVGIMGGDLRLDPGRTSFLDWPGPNLSRLPAAPSVGGTNAVRTQSLSGLAGPPI